MLVLRRREGQWIEIKHEKSGDMVRIRTYDVLQGRLKLAFDDPDHNFTIERTERAAAEPAVSTT